MATRRVRIDNDPGVKSDMENYCATHPFGAAALRHPHIVMDQGRYVVYTSRSVKGGIVGFGTSVGSALHAFDDIYSRTAWERGR